MIIGMLSQVTAELKTAVKERLRPKHEEVKENAKGGKKRRGGLKFKGRYPGPGKT